MNCIACGKPLKFIDPTDAGQVACYCEFGPCVSALSNRGELGNYRNEAAEKLNKIIEWELDAKKARGEEFAKAFDKIVERHNASLLTNEEIKVIILQTLP